MSLYGLGRFPVTLYKEQWVKLLDMADDIRAFFKEHDAELKEKKPRETRRISAPAPSSHDWRYSIMGCHFGGWL